jgi:hypothetical protein
MQRRTIAPRRLPLISSQDSGRGTMFGFFKQKITPEELGHTATKWANEFLVNDAAVSLGILFDDFFDRDKSLTPAQYLECHGIPPAKTHLYIRTFAHCSVQAASTQFNQGTGRAVTRGAMAGFKETPHGYDFETTYNALEKIYRGHHHFQPKIEALDNPSYHWPILPNPKAGILNAKYLIENFVTLYVKNTNVLGDGFSLFSGKVGGGLDIVLRAMTQLSKSTKLA